MTDLYANLLIAFTIGLAGSSHCLVMCGGISTSLAHLNQPLKSTLAYNLGRLSSYSLIGFILGLVGTTLLSHQQGILYCLKILSGVLLIGMGLYVTRWYMGLTYIERLFVPIWNLIKPVAATTLTQQTMHYKLFAGFLWGWLPCGLIYSTLSWAVSFIDPVTSSLLMLTFGLGTLPAMLLTSIFAIELKKVLASYLFKCVSGLLLIGYGLYTINQGILKLSPNIVS